MRGIFSQTKVVIGNATGEGELFIPVRIALIRIGATSAYLGNAGSYAWSCVSLTAVDLTLILSAAMNQSGILMSSFSANSSATNYLGTNIGTDFSGEVELPAGTRLKLYTLHSGGTLITTQFTVVGTVL